MRHRGKLIMGILSGSKGTDRDDEGPFQVASVECRASDGNVYSLDLDRTREELCVTLGLQESSNVPGVLAAKVGAFLDHPAGLPADPDNPSDAEAEASLLLLAAVQELLRLCDEGLVTSLVCREDRDGHHIVVAARHVVTVF